MKIKQIIKYKELTRSDWETLALVLTENGHADDIEVDFREGKNGLAEVIIRIIPENQ